MVGQLTANRIANSVTGATWGAGQNNSVNYTNAMIGDNYETQTLTVAAKDYSRTMNVMVTQYYGADQEGYFMKDIEIGLSKPYENVAFNSINTTATNAFVPENRTSFATIKKRLGGRIR